MLIARYMGAGEKVRAEGVKSENTLWSFGRKMYGPSRNIFLSQRRENRERKIS